MADPQEKPVRLAITGQSGFIGSWLYRKAALNKAFRCVEFPRSLFERPGEMRRVLAETDAVVHLAGMSRNPDGALLYRTNVQLMEQVIQAAPAGTRIYLGSTTHEQKDLPYHASKRECRRLLEARGNSGTFLMANTFGPGSKPYFNSVVSTFCRMAADDLVPERIDNAILPLIYVDDLCREILRCVKEKRGGVLPVPETFTIPLPELWTNLQQWKNGAAPPQDRFLQQLYSTFLTY